MEETKDSSVDRSRSEFYLPGMPQVSAEAGRVERFVRRLLRQRGEYRVRVSRKN